MGSAVIRLETGGCWKSGCDVRRGDRRRESEDAFSADIGNEIYYGGKMKISDICYSVVWTLIIPISLYYAADSENDQTSELEEMVFPRK